MLAQMMMGRQTAANKEGASTNNVQAEAVWVEKYRPKTMDDIASQEEAVAVLKKTMESANLPHLLFYGPPGTGKTSSILALCRTLYGPDLYKSRVLELNASDERGIDVVREKVRDFARYTVAQHSTGYPSPPYKIVILDEADSMTVDAQSALRRTMETYSKSTRFCLICNYVSRIIEPLTSRCAKFRFKPLDPSSTRGRLEHICEAEGVNYKPEAIDALITVSEGDLRKAIMYLQSAHRRYGVQNVAIDQEAIFEIAGVLSDTTIANIFEKITTKKFNEIATLTNTLVLNGFPASQIVAQVHERLSLDPTFTSRQKSLMSQALIKAEKCLVDGADEYLQLISLLWKLSQCQ
ncbi:hypothetical protein SmJEL517_g03270 [Synchytrium microbalum]|uniref:AAA+ ATPase domain-containing protein n=1 Tax=Synchytrium microbalum TaxID=1806994 RepID=A0A507C966_9FUNG|nr:uncharacterized protein SmJEL517_g03270 [Synchytrium microbalum]TPX34083.1 hypothetical protein SmJEL517_g03270 [Synchytrium microbalum]